MSYSKENFLQVSREFADKRARAKAESEEKCGQLHEQYPDIAEVDKKLSQTAMKLFDEITAGSEGIRERVAAVRRENEELQSERAALLQKYGYPAEYTKIRYACDICKDTGYDGIRMCVCMKRALTEAGFRSSGIGKLLDIQSFDNFSLQYYTGDAKKEMTDNLARCKAYAETFDEKEGKNLLLFGGTGLGKTHLTTSMAKVIIEKGCDVVYDSAQSIFKSFEDERFRRSETAYTDRYFDCDLLIFDDLGTEMGNQFTVSTLYGIINERMIKGKSTIISTNLSIEELQKRYTDRVLSRLLGEYTVLRFSGKDIRLQKLGVR